MKQTDAAQILGLAGEVTPETIKQAYRAAARTYHPDVNPAGLEMMKLINEAFDTLKDFEGNLAYRAPASGVSYPDALNEALNAILHTPLDIEICGAWIWISGPTYEHKDLLREVGFKWAPKKKQWYFRPEDWKSRGRGGATMDDIRTRYGSVRPEHRRRDELEVA